MNLSDLVQNHERYKLFSYNSSPILSKCDKRSLQETCNIAPVSALKN